MYLNKNNQSNGFLQAWHSLQRLGQLRHAQAGMAEFDLLFGMDKRSAHWPNDG